MELWVTLVRSHPMSHVDPGNLCAAPSASSQCFKVYRELGNGVYLRILIYTSPLSGYCCKQRSAPV